MRFRNLAAVDSDAHGTQSDEFRTVVLDGKKWTCIRPKRALTRLEYDVKSEGFRRVPAVLFDLEPAECRLDEENRVWYAGLPEPFEIASAFLVADEWLSNHLGDREAAFGAVKAQVDATISALEGDALDVQSVCEHLRSWKELCARAFPYMFLVLTMDDLILKTAQLWLGRLGTLDRTTLILSELCRSEYVRNAVENGAVPKLSKSLEFPPAPTFRAVGGVDRSLFLRSATLMKAIANCKDWHEAQTVLRMAERASLAFQLSEENFHVMGSLTTAYENLLYRYAVSIEPDDPTGCASRYLDMTVDECIADIKHSHVRRQT